MQQFMLAFAVCALSPALSYAALVPGETEEALRPLTAPKPLIPLEQIDGPLPDDYVIAKLDGKSIRLSELFESLGYTEKLKELRKKVTARQFRSAQERLLKRNLKPYLELQLCVREYRRQLPQEQNDKIDLALHEMWQKELKKLQARFEVNSVQALEEQLRQRGVQSLSGMRRNFENRTMAAEYCRSRVGSIEGSEAKAEAFKAIQEKLFAEADLQTVVDLSDKPAETTSTDEVPPRNGLTSLSQVEGPLPDDFIVAEIDGERIQLIDVVKYAGQERQMNRLRDRYLPIKYRLHQERFLHEYLPVMLEDCLLRKERLKLSADADAPTWRQIIDSLHDKTPRYSLTASGREREAQVLPNNDIPVSTGRIIDDNERIRPFRDFVDELRAEAKIKTVLRSTHGFSEIRTPRRQM